MSVEAEILNEAAQAAESAGVLGSLGINGKIFLAQLFNFLLVLIVLWRFAYRPIVKLLDERAKKIEQGVKDAQNAEVRLKQIEDEKDRVIALAKQEAVQILEAARTQGQERTQEATQKAKREVERVIAQGKMQLKAEKEGMLREAREEMVEVIVAGVKRVLSDQVDEKKSTSLAEEVVRKMT